MPGWAAFVGLTVLIVALLLVLAALSQQANGSPGDGARHSLRKPQRDHVIPRFEPPGQAESEQSSQMDVPDMSTGALLANVALTQGLFGGFLVAGALYFQIPLTALGLGGTSLATGLTGLMVGLGFGLVLWLGNEGAGALTRVISAGYDDSFREMLAPDSLGGWFLLLGAVLPTIAFVEEFIFRAAAIGALSAGTGGTPWAFAVVSSLAFGVAHGAQGRIGIVVTAALGFALAGGFVLTESLLVVVLAHYLVNSLELVIHEGMQIGDVSERI